MLFTEWEKQQRFDSFVASENFRIFKDRVLPHSQALPVPQLYNTSVQPCNVFENGLSEVWQMKIGKGNDKAAESEAAWKKFVHAVAEAGGVTEDEENFYGESLNLEERRWVGALGWKSSEVSFGIIFSVIYPEETIELTLESQIREKVLGDTAVKEAKKELDVLVWNTFLAGFAK